MTPAPAARSEPLGALTVNAFCRWASVGRTTAYEEIKAGRLRPVYLRGRTIIPFAEAQRWLDALPARRPSPSQSRATVRAEQHV